MITIDGPADIELASKDVARLHRGQIAAYVPKGAEGYQVLTESAEITDLGTEFGVTVADDRSSQLIVFDGEVEFSAMHGESELPIEFAIRLDCSPENVRSIRVLALDRNDDTDTEIWHVRRGRTKTAPAIFRRGAIS